MAGKPQKPPGTLTGHRQNRQLRVLPPRASEPAPPLRLERVQVKTQELWDLIWQSPSATLWDRKSDIPQLEHLMWCIDERDRSRRALSRRRIIRDSKGRVTLNPLSGYIARLDRTIAQIAEKFGITSLDRMRLGVSFGEAKRSLADIMNAEMDGDKDEDDGNDDPAVIDMDSL